MNHETENKESLISELSERLLNGVFKENPTFVLLLGMCPTLAVTTSAKNGLGMGVTTMVVLALSNLFISLLRKVIPDKIRIPAFIVIIASFVTMVELLLEAYIPSLYSALGLYIPLIVVNCIILGRAEAYAYSHKALPSLFDGLGMGMGFTLALTLIGAFRELLGAGTVFSFKVMPASYVPVNIFIMAPGAFFVLAMLTAIQNKVREIGERKGKDMSKIQSGCGGNCMECNKECKVSVVTAEASETEVDKEAGNESSDTVASSEKTDENPEATTEKKALAKKEKGSLFKKKAKAEDSADADETIVQEHSNEVPVTDVNSPDLATEEDSAEVREADSEASKTEDEEKNTEVSDDDLELLDISSPVKTEENNKTVKKPKRKKASVEKAQAMLIKAEETLKEEEGND